MPLAKACLSNYIRASYYRIPRQISGVDRATMVERYLKVLMSLKDLGAKEVQIHEPILVTEHAIGSTEASSYYNFLERLHSQVLQLIRLHHQQTAHIHYRSIRETARETRGKNSVTRAEPGPQFKDLHPQNRLSDA